MSSKTSIGFPFWIGLILISLTGSAAAYRIETWSSANDITSITAGPDGIWSSSTGGVVHWDSGGYEKYTTADHLNDNWCTDICRDATGNIWVGTLFGGVLYNDGVRWDKMTVHEGLLYNHVTTVAGDARGRVWMGFGGAFGFGMGIYDAGEWIYLTTAEGMPGNLMNDIVTFDSGAWVGTQNGLVLIDAADRISRIFTTADGMISDIVRCIAMDSDGIVWIGTPDGLHSFDGSVFQTFTTADGLPDNRIVSIMADSGGTVWAGTNSGLGYFTGSVWQVFPLEEVTADPRVKALAGFPGDGILAGLEAGGIIRIEQQKITDHYLTGDPLPRNEVRALAFEGRVLWYTTVQGGVGTFDGSNWKAFGRGTGIENSDVFCMAVDLEGVKWFGCFGNGLFRFDGNEWQHITAPDPLPSNNISSIFVDEGNWKWFATWGGGICRYDNADWMIIDHEDGLPNDLTYDVTRDHNGSYWFCTDIGVSRFDGENITSWYESDGLVFHRVYEAEEDRDYQMWFGACRGLSRFDGETFRNYFTEDGLAHYRIHEIVFDPDGLMWLATGGGANTFDGRTFVSIKPEDGFAGYETFTVIHGPDGSHWFGSRGGITAIYPDEQPSDCTETGVDLIAPDMPVSSGDSFFLGVEVCNASSEPLQSYPLFVILEVAGAFFYAPSFGAQMDHYGREHPSFEPGKTEITVISTIAWPDEVSPGSAVVYAALTDPGITRIEGYYSEMSLLWK